MQTGDGTEMYSQPQWLVFGHTMHGKPQAQAVLGQVPTVPKPGPDKAAAFLSEPG